MGAAGAGREPPRGSRRSLTEREGAAAGPNLRSSTSWGRSLSGQRPGTSRRNRREHRAPPDPASARPRLTPRLSPPSVVHAGTCSPQPPHGVQENGVPPLRAKHSGRCSPAWIGRSVPAAARGRLSGGRPLPEAGACV